MKNDKLFTMGASFDERSDDEEKEEEKTGIELNMSLHNNSNKSFTVENIPLVSK